MIGCGYGAGPSIGLEKSLHRFFIANSTSQLLSLNSALLWPKWSCKYIYSLALKASSYGKQKVSLLRIQMIFFVKVKVSNTLHARNSLQMRAVSIRY